MRARRALSRPIPWRTAEKKYGWRVGESCWSLTATDVHTQWTETRAVSNRGRYEVAKRIAEIEAALPFAILGFDTDNGGEFLNYSTGICSTISPAAGTRWALPVPESIAKRQRACRARGTGRTCVSWWAMQGWRIPELPSPSMSFTPRNRGGFAILPGDEASAH
jgi:hypothetical protein